MKMIHTNNNNQTIRASVDPEVGVGSRDVVCVRVKRWTMKGVGTDQVWGRVRADENEKNVNPNERHGIGYHNKKGSN